MQHAPVSTAKSPSLTQQNSSSSAPDISVVIVSYRTREQVRDCLASLYAGGGLNGVSAEVLLIDNDSRDGTPEMVAADFPQVRLIASKDNLGFAKGNNRGIALAQGKNVLLLNPDTLVPEGTLQKCLAYLDSQDARVGAMTCRVQSRDGSLQWTCSRRLITPWSESVRALLLDRVFSKSDLFNPEPMVHWDRTDARPVPCLLGAFMLIRKPVLDKIGGLDEQYFLMYEDVDWCKRAGDAGYELHFWPGAYITHLGGESWKQEPIETYANSHASAMLYFHKHHASSVGKVRFISQVGMELKIALLRVKLLLRPRDSYATKHLAMAQAARRALRTGEAPAGKASSNARTSESVG